MTLDEFAREVSEFRKVMGTRSFWALEAKHHDGALRGLSHAYLAVRGTDDETRLAAVAYDSSVQEYERRAAYG